MIEDEERCPFGHKNIEHAGLVYHYVFCYDCKKRFTQEDYEDGE